MSSNTKIPVDSQPTTDCSAEEVKSIAPTGLFRPLIAQYMAAGKAHHQPDLFPRVRGTLGNFFRFLAQTEGIETNPMDQIRKEPDVQ